MAHTGGARKAGATTRGVRRSTAFLSIFLMAMFGLVGMSGSPASADPPGNNGTVKISGVEMDSVPNNQPHVGCDFFIEWFNFDEGVSSTVTFAMHAPTADVGLSGTDPSVVPLSGDPAGGSQAYTLEFDGLPHPVQGYHVKLTVNTPGSIGADKKHKVFWVEGCGDEIPPEPSNTENRDNTSVDCPTDTVTTVFEERSENFEFNEETGQWESTGFSDWEVVDTDTRPANNQECPPEVEGEEDEIPGPKDNPQQNPVEVAGEQAVAPPAAAPPTAVNAGLGEIAPTDSSRSPLGLLMVMFGALLTAAAVTRRRARA